MNVTRSLGNRTGVSIYRAFSNDVLPVFPAGYFDAVYVDGDHTYGGAVRDLEPTVDDSPGSNKSLHCSEMPTACSVLRRRVPPLVQGVHVHTHHHQSLYNGRISPFCSHVERTETGNITGLLVHAFCDVRT
jgi:hypothetical protein